jgi:hypothetical protein
MLYFFHGTDREKARLALNKAVEKLLKTHEVIRITDAHTIGDLQMALSGPGMFGGAQIVVLDGVLGGGNIEMRDTLLNSLKRVRDIEDRFFMLEGALDAATRKQVEKYAERSEKFDAAKKEKDNTIFALANALEAGDKKELWVKLMQQYAKGAAPEAVHGLLFWGAKQMFLKARASEARVRAGHLIAKLVELPHEARRRGEDLEYALERFVLEGR